MSPGHTPLRAAAGKNKVLKNNIPLTPPPARNRRYPRSPHRYCPSRNHIPPLPLPWPRLSPNPGCRIRAQAGPPHTHHAPRHSSTRKVVAGQAPTHLEEARSRWAGWGCTAAEGEIQVPGLGGPERGAGITNRSLIRAPFPLPLSLHERANKLMAGSNDVLRFHFIVLSFSAATRLNAAMCEYIIRHTLSLQYGSRGKEYQR